MKNKEVQKEITLIDIFDEGTLRKVKNWQEKEEMVENTEQICFTKILDLVKKNGNNTSIIDIVDLIDECTLNTGNEIHSIYYIGLWIKLYELVKTNVNVPIRIRKEIFAREQIKNNSIKDQFDKLPNEFRYKNKAEILKKDGKIFSLKQIAFLHIYNGDPITKDNCDTQAKKYGWSSGHKLMQNYSDAIKRLDTKGLSDIQLKNRIDLINSIIDYVRPEKQQRPKDDLIKLDTDLEEKRGF